MMRQATNLNTWFVQMADIRRCLARLLTKHECLLTNAPECINDDLPKQDERTFEELTFSGGFETKKTDSGKSPFPSHSVQDQPQLQQTACSVARSSGFPNKIIFCAALQTHHEWNTRDKVDPCVCTCCVFTSVLDSQQPKPGCE